MKEAEGSLFVVLKKYIYKCLAITTLPFEGKKNMKLLYLSCKSVKSWPESVDFSVFAQRCRGSVVVGFKLNFREWKFPIPFIYSIIYALIDTSAILSVNVIDNVIAVGVMLYGLV